jgi:hypothetical protein
VLFPTAQFLTVGNVSVIAKIARLGGIEGGFKNLFPNPSLSRLDGRPAVGTLLGAQEHLSFPFLENKMPFAAYKSCNEG